MYTTFSRNSADWAFAANRLLAESAPDVARLEYDPATGERLGLPIFRQFTNSVISDFSGFSTRRAQLAKADYSHFDAYTLSTTGGYSGLFKDYFFPIDGTPWISSVWMRAGTWRYAGVGVRGSAVVSYYCIFDLKTGAALGDTNIRDSQRVTIRPQFDDWFELSVVSPNGSNSDNKSSSFCVVFGAADGTINVPENAGTIEVALPRALFGVPYVPDLQIVSTEGQTTRAADFLDAPTGAWYRPGEATIRGAWRWSRDANEPVVLATAGGIRVYQGSDGLPVLDGPGELITDATDPQPGELVRYCWMLDAPDVDRWTIGRDYDDSHWINSHIVDLDFQERRITPAQARAELGL